MWTLFGRTTSSMGFTVSPPPNTRTRARDRTLTRRAAGAATPVVDRLLPDDNVQVILPNFESFIDIMVHAHTLTRTHMNTKGADVCVYVCVFCSGQ